MRGAGLVAGRELASFFRAPIGIGVWVAFLVVQGASFAATLYALADPARPAPYGAVMRAHFGGTFLYWAFLFLVVALLGMRMISLERRAGTWELLASAPVSDTALVVGKWLGALAIYAVLWIPTVAYVAIIAAFAPEGAAPDPGPIAAAYLGVLVTGAGFLAVAACASAVTANPMGAAALAFAGLMLWFLAGLAPELAPGLPGERLLRVIDPRQQLDDFARGIIDTRHLALYVALVAVGLTVAVQLVAAPRRSGEARRRGVAGALLAGLCAVLAVALVARHPLRLDATAAGVYRLDDRTESVLAGVRTPVEILVLEGGAPEFRPLWEAVHELLAQMQAEQPRLRIETLDPVEDPSRIAILAEQFSIGAEELLGGGAVVFRAGDRRRAVGLLDMAEFGRDAAGGGALVAFRGETLFASALLEVTDTGRRVVCVTTGHGELPLERTADDHDAAALADALVDDGYAVRALDTLVPAVAGDCSVLVILGPTRPLGAEEAIAVDTYLQGGGRLLLAVGANPDAALERLEPTGLETVLGSWGIRLRSAVVVDPAGEVGLPRAWATLRGYSAHPLVSPFNGRRVTVWIEPRWIEPVGGEPLVTSSPGSWAEQSWAPYLRDGIAAKDASDPAGPLPVAVTARSQLVVLGSVRSFATRVVSQHPANALLVRASIAWLTGRRELAGVAHETPEQLRVVMTSAQARLVVALAMAGLPALVGLVGAAYLWWRRRS